MGLGQYGALLMDWQAAELESVPCDLCGATQAPRVYLRPDGLQVVLCAECGLCYLNPRPSPELVRHLLQHGLLLPSCRRLSGGLPGLSQPCQPNRCAASGSGEVGQGISRSAACGPQDAGVWAASRIGGEITKVGLVYSPLLNCRDQQRRGGTAPTNVRAMSHVMPGEPWSTEVQAC